MGDPHVTGQARPGRFLGRPDTAYPGYVPPAPAGPATPATERPAVRPGERSRAGRMWLVQALTGAVLVGALGIHLVAQHLLAPGGLRDYASVVAYLRQPVALLIEVALLGSVIVHAGLGMRSSLVDVLGERWLRRVSLLIAVVGTVAFGYGLWLFVAVLGAAEI